MKNHILSNWIKSQYKNNGMKNHENQHVENLLKSQLGIQKSQ